MTFKNEEDFVTLDDFLSQIEIRDENEDFRWKTWNILFSKSCENGTRIP